ncbi:MAG: SH3 domain-containing protein [Candidatus Sericytochromatia bacterium]|nr:SH3 domain-containing protein [Candidatus Sericytochromatia bacterium]
MSESDLFSCPQCHRAILPGDQFCAGCGFLLQSNATPEAQAANASFWSAKPLDQFQALLSRHRLITGLAALGLLLILGVFSLWRPWQKAAEAPSPIVFSATPSPVENPTNSPSGETNLNGVSAAAEVAKDLAPTASPRWKTAQGLLNIRSKPSLQAEVLMRLQGGEIYTGTGKTEMAEGHTWIELQINEKERGWISAQLLSAVAVPSNTPASVSSSSPKNAQTPLQASTQTSPERSAGRMLNHEKLSGWILGEPADRQRTALAMTRLMFPTDPAELLNKKAILLETCITGSAEDISIKNHEVAQIGAICALLLGWQEKEQVSPSTQP